MRTRCPLPGEARKTRRGALDARRNGLCARRRGSKSAASRANAARATRRTRRNWTLRDKKMHARAEPINAVALCQHGARPWRTDPRADRSGGAAKCRARRGSLSDVPARSARRRRPFLWACVFPPNRRGNKQIIESRWIRARRRGCRRPAASGGGGLPGTNRKRALARAAEERGRSAKAGAVRSVKRNRGAPETTKENETEGMTNGERRSGEAERRRGGGVEREGRGRRGGRGWREGFLGGGRGQGEPRWRTSSLRPHRGGQGRGRFRASVLRRVRGIRNGLRYLLCSFARFPASLE